MPLKKKVVKKKVVTKKKAPKAKAAVTKKKVVRKKATAKKAPVSKTQAGGGKYAYEPYKEKKNIGNCAKNLILKGRDTDTIVELVKEEFPDTNITFKSIGYYRNALRKEGYDVPSARG